MRYFCDTQQKAVYGHAIISYGKSRGIRTLFCILGTRFTKKVTFAYRPSFFREKIRYPLDTRLGGHQSQYGRFGEKKNLLSVPGLVPGWANPGFESRQ
jgi:hypothetical protein